jgi:hypothetical protein
VLLTSLHNGTFNESEKVHTQRFMFMALFFLQNVTFMPSKRRCVVLRDGQEPTTVGCRPVLTVIAEAARTMDCKNVCRKRAQNAHIMGIHRSSFDDIKFYTFNSRNNIVKYPKDQSIIFKKACGLILQFELSTGRENVRLVANLVS